MHFAPQEMRRALILALLLSVILEMVSSNVATADTQVHEMSEALLTFDANALAQNTTLWESDHESGTFYEWSIHSGWGFWDSQTDQISDQNRTGGPRIFGNPLFNNGTAPGSCVSTISTDIARSGQYALRMEVTGADSRVQSCRTFRRWLEIDGDDGVELPDKAYYSAWYYIPKEFETIEWWNIFQFKSRAEGHGSDPLFSFNIDSDGRGNRSLYIYQKLGDSCSCSTGCGSSYINANVQTVNLPIQEWFHLEAYLDQSSVTSDRVNADGRLKVWINGVATIQADDVCTHRYPEGRVHWSVNNYTDDILPPDMTLYVDDAAIRTEQTDLSQNSDGYDAIPQDIFYYINSVYTCDGQDDLIKVNDIQIATPFTLEMWVKPSTVNGSQTLFDQVNYNRDGIAILIDDGYFTFWWWDDAGQWRKLQSTRRARANLWGHVALTYDGVSKAELFINGESDGPWHVGNLSQQESQYYFCGHPASEDYLSGEIEDVRLSDSVRYRSSFDPPIDSPSVYEDTLLLWSMESVDNQRIYDDAGQRDGLILDGDEVQAALCHAQECGDITESVLNDASPEGRASGSRFEIWVPIY